jgi:phage/plasmid-like protein (TIGR03299 family)
MLLINNSNNSIDALEILLQAGLDWEVIKLPTVTVSDNPEFNGLACEEFSLWRSDNKKQLGSFKKGYFVYQNQKLAELIVTLADKIGCPVHKAGMLQGGGKVYIQLKSDDLTLGNDRISGYLTAMNSFDGSISLAFGQSTITISCQNTFNGAYRQVENKVKHTASMEYRIEDILRSYDRFKEDEKQHFEFIRQLASAPATEKAEDLIYREMFKVSLADLRANTTAKPTVTTKNLNNILRFQDALARELSDKGNTLWGLFSGVTRYTTHLMGVETSESKEASKMAGAVATKEQKLFNAFAELVK